jgi:hypothetical protein
MRQVILGAAVVALMTSLTASAGERSVIVPVGDKPCEVSENDTVRVTANGISGSKIEVKVSGKAKVESETTVIERAGGQNKIGSTVKEFDIKPTGKGKVTVTVTVTPPQPDAKPKVTEVEIDVK